MIKKGIAAVLLALFLLGLSLTGLFYTNYTADEMDRLLTEALKASQDQDRDKAVEFSEKAFEAWERQHRYLCTYMSHTKLETIDQSLAALSPLAAYETWDQFTAECRRC